MRKDDNSPPGSRHGSVTTAPNLTDEQMDKAVAALLADVLSSIDRVLAGAAKSEPGVASAPTAVSATPEEHG